MVGKQRCASSIQKEQPQGPAAHAVQGCPAGEPCMLVQSAKRLQHLAKEVSQTAQGGDSRIWLLPQLNKPGRGGWWRQSVVPFQIPLPPPLSTTVGWSVGRRLLLLPSPHPEGKISQLQLQTFQKVTRGQPGGMLSAWTAVPLTTLQTPTHSQGKPELPCC